MSSSRIPPALPPRPAAWLTTTAIARVAEPDLARERRFRHAGHADHVGAVALQAVDLGGGFEARSLRRRVGAAGDHAPRPPPLPRLEQPLAHRLAVRMREIDVRHAATRRA